MKIVFEKVVRTPDSIVSRSSTSALPSFEGGDSISIGD
jgi:hypothetical protein